MPTIRVRASKEYDIHIGHGLLDDVGALTAAVKKPCAIMLVADSNVAPLYADRVAASYENAGFAVHRFTFAAGEASKNMDTLVRLLEALGEAQLTRSDLLAALGGGVTGDLTGFAAAVYQRGVDFVQIPTTLLAAVDSSVGGKTAVDLACGKNMAGCFWQPCLVVCDPDVFATLTPAIFADGMAEVIKYGVILDEPFFRWLEGCDPRAGIETIVARCCELKRQVVEEDERDTGRRALLNFGHTIGHAIEKCSHFEVSHGSGVAIGMVAMARAAAANGCAPADLAGRIAALCVKNDLPTEVAMPAAALCAAARGDKKRGAGGITVVTPDALGAAATKKLTLEELDAWIAAGISTAAESENG